MQEHEITTQMLTEISEGNHGHLREHDQITVSCSCGEKTICYSEDHVNSWIKNHMYEMLLQATGLSVKRVKLKEIVKDYTKR